MLYLERSGEVVSDVSAQVPEPIAPSLLPKRVITASLIKYGGGYFAVLKEADEASDAFGYWDATVEFRRDYSSALELHLKNLDYIKRTVKIAVEGILEELNNILKDVDREVERLKRSSQRQ